MSFVSRFILAAAAACVALFLSLTLHFEFERDFEAARALFVVVAIMAIGYMWSISRKHVRSWIGLSLLGSFLATLVLADAWSGLNVGRVYLYEPSAEGKQIYSYWYFTIC